MKEIKCTYGLYARSFNDIDFVRLQFRDTQDAYRTLKIHIIIYIPFRSILFYYIIVCYNEAF